MPKQQNTIKAILNEYTNTFSALEKIVKGIDANTLVHIFDKETKDIDCASIQNILEHVCSSGYFYIEMIQEFKKLPIEKGNKKLRYFSSSEYIHEFKKVIQFTENTLLQLDDKDFGNSENLNTSWGQKYDLEQLMEHAIVHVMRHRWQIEKFLFCI